MLQKYASFIEREIVDGLIQGKHPVYTLSASSTRRLYRICVSLGYDIDGPNMNIYPLGGPRDFISAFFNLQSTPSGKKYILAIVSKYNLFMANDAICFPEIIFKL